MQASLLIVSLLFWWPIVSPCSASAKRVSGFGKLGYIVLATIPQTFGGLLVALAGHVLYTRIRQRAPSARLRSREMTDQQSLREPALPWVSKIALLFAAFFVIFMNLLNAGSDGREEDGGGGGGGRFEPPKSTLRTPRPSGIPRWLEDLGDGRTTDEPTVIPRPIRVPVGSGSRPGLDIAALSRWLAEDSRISETACSTLVPG